MFFHNTTYEVQITNDFGESEALEFKIVNDYKSLFGFKNSTNSYEIGDYIASELKLIFHVPFVHMAVQPAKNPAGLN